MISIILVSHSKQITDGLKIMIDEMAANQENVTVFSVGGSIDGKLGTNPLAIYDQIEKRFQDEAILIFTDIGSAILSAELALDMLEDGLRKKVHIMDFPLVEGSFITAVKSDGSADIKEILVELKEL